VQGAPRLWLAAVERACRGRARRLWLSPSYDALTGGGAESGAGATTRGDESDLAGARASAARRELARLKLMRRARR